MSSSKPISKVILVGAGPSGLLLGILLAKQGIKVLILDAGKDLDTNPRAAHYAPSSCYELDRAGVLDQIHEEGFVPDAVCWRAPDRSMLAKISSGSVTGVDYKMVVLPLDRLGKLLMRNLLKQPTAEVKWQHKVIDIEHGDSEARVIVEHPHGQKETFSADYVIGSDGANSQIRRSLFGDWNYPGETLQHQIIATNVYYDFHKFGYLDSNFIIDPENWYMAARITTDGLWRVTYGDVWGLSNEEYLKRQPMRYEKILPGNPKPEDYKLAGASPYKLQQRCAEKFRVGRFLLVADAAHLCNPFGGMGLTGGFADVGSLFDCLMAIQEGHSDDSILDKYSEVRIKIWKDMIDPISRRNFRLIWDPEVDDERKEFWAMCDKASKDEELARTLANSTHALRVDFSKYWTKKD